MPVELPSIVHIAVFLRRVAGSETWVVAVILPSCCSFASGVSIADASCPNTYGESGLRPATVGGGALLDAGSKVIWISEPITRIGVFGNMHRACRTIRVAGSESGLIVPWMTPISSTLIWRDFEMVFGVYRWSLGRFRIVGDFVGFDIEPDVL